MGSKPFKRRQILIKKNFQLKYAVMIAVTLLLMLVFVEWDVFYTMKKVLPGLADVEKIRPNLIMMYIMIGAKSLIFIFIVTIVSVYFLHRIAGPIYRLENDILSMIEDGDLTRKFRLRDKDELKELADALNTLTNNLRLKLLSDEQYHEMTMEGLTYLQKYIQNMDAVKPEEKKKILLKIEGMINQSTVSPVNFKI